MEDEVVPRRQQILEALARELEGEPGGRITIARLARAVGVSEAALYRHFPSKAKMFEALIEFAEETVFTLINRVLREEREAPRGCEKVLGLLLGFSERNPGITRVLLGDALVGENGRLRDRVARFFNRIETQIKQVLREGQAAGTVPPAVPVVAAAGLLLAVVEGKMGRYARSGFERRPLEGWGEQWPRLAAGLFD